MTFIKNKYLLYKKEVIDLKRNSEAHINQISTTKLIINSSCEKAGYLLLINNNKKKKCCPNILSILAKISSCSLSQKSFLRRLTDNTRAASPECNFQNTCCQEHVKRWLEEKKITRSVLPFEVTHELYCKRMSLV